MIFTLNDVTGFFNENPTFTWGEGFYEHMELHKVTDPDGKTFCEAIRDEPDNQRAWSMAVDYAIAQQPNLSKE